MYNWTQTKISDIHEDVPTNGNDASALSFQIVATAGALIGSKYLAMNSASDILACMMKCLSSEAK